MAEAEGARRGTSFSIRHTGNVAERIAEVKQSIKELRSQHDQTHQLFEELAQIPVDETAVKTFTQLFLPSPADHGEFCSDRVAANVARARGTFQRIYAESVTTEDLPENGYRLLQSATEYLDHVREFRSPESKMGRSLLRPEAHKTRAVNLIRDLVDA
jgi:hypothetical protein